MGKKSIAKKSSSRKNSKTDSSEEKNVKEPVEDVNEESHEESEEKEEVEEINEIVITNSPKKQGVSKRIQEDKGEEKEKEKRMKEERESEEAREEDNTSVDEVEENTKNENKLDEDVKEKDEEDKTIEVTRIVKEDSTNTDKDEQEEDSEAKNVPDMSDKVENPSEEEDKNQETSNSESDEESKSKPDTYPEKTSRDMTLVESLKNEEEEENQETQVTEAPIFESLEIHMDVIKNRIAIKPSFGSLTSMKLLCSLILQGENLPSTEKLVYRVPLLGQQLQNTDGHDTLYLVTADIHSVEAISCIGYTPPNIFYGPREISIEVAPPPSPDIKIRVIEQTPLSLEVYVKSSMEARVWCKVVKETSSTVSIELVRTGSQRIVRRRASMYFKDLTPDTKYQIWCYAESKEGIPMKQSLEEVMISTRTTERTSIL